MVIEAAKSRRIIPRVFMEKNGEVRYVKLGSKTSASVEGRGLEGIVKGRCAIVVKASKEPTSWLISSLDPIQ